MVNDWDATQLELGLSGPRQNTRLGENATVLAGYALPFENALKQGVATVVRHSPFRHMVTPGGSPMSAAMTNCGVLGWVSDRSGYRYSPIDPLAETAWPAMPRAFSELASQAAAELGFDGFAPNACLVNRYEVGARMGLHQDRDEEDLSAPIVSVSLGIPAVFQFGGLSRRDKTTRVRLVHGDVVVWGGPDRLRFHGVLPIKDSEHPFAGRARINLTFRRT